MKPSSGRPVAERFTIFAGDLKTAQGYQSVRNLAEPTAKDLAWASRAMSHTSQWFAYNATVTVLGALVPSGLGTMDKPGC